MENVKLKLPTKLSAIKLKDFQKYMSIVENNPDADRNFLEIKLMEIFCGLKYKNIEGLPFGIFEDSVILSKTPLVRRFIMKGIDGAEVEFGFLPNLDKITMGEYIDLTNYIGDIKTMHKAMAVLFRPIHESYRHRQNYRVSMRGIKNSMLLQEVQHYESMKLL